MSHVWGTGKCLAHQLHDDGVILYAHVSNKDLTWVLELTDLLELAVLGKGEDERLTSQTIFESNAF
ncbi:MAG: hypothetical protein M3530_10320 [Thermoproteota archaeon]|nr:hypothetical protein [Thermoproteota archaeon]